MDWKGKKCLNLYGWVIVFGKEIKEVGKGSGSIRDYKLLVIREYCFNWVTLKGCNILIERRDLDGDFCISIMFMILVERIRVFLL